MLTWSLRGTLHLHRTEDALWLVPLLAARLVQGDQRRLRALGWDDTSLQAGLRLLEKELGKKGSLAREKLRELLAALRLPHEGQAPQHLVYVAALQGLLCLGPQDGRNPLLVPLEQWAGKLTPLDRPEALQRLALRYLEAYAPAAPADLAAWSGIPLGEAREAWRSISAETVEIEAGGEPAWMLRRQLEALEEKIPAQVRLLPRYDTLLLGYASRAWILSSRHARQVHPGGGIIRSSVLAEGRIAGTWSLKRRKQSYTVEAVPFGNFSSAKVSALQVETADLSRFLEAPVKLETGLLKNSNEALHPDD
jgi:hypothetical protein